MSNEIYVDPSSNPPGVIRVGSTCYKQDGPSDMPPDTFGVSAGFSDCESCEDNGCPCRRVTMHIKAYTDSTFTTVCWEGDVDAITCPDNNGLSYGGWGTCSTDPNACPPGFELYDSGGGPSTDPSACYAVSLRFGGNWTQIDIGKCDGTPFGDYPDRTNVCDNLGYNCVDITNIHVEPVHYCLPCCSETEDCPDSLTMTVEGTTDYDGSFELTRTGCGYYGEEPDVAIYCSTDNHSGGGYKWGYSIAGAYYVEQINDTGCPPTGTFSLPCGGSVTIA